MTYVSLGFFILMKAYETKKALFKSGYEIKMMGPGLDRPCLILSPSDRKLACRECTYAI